MIRYFDASALVKRYATEAGSVAVRRLMRDPVATSRLSEVEIASALVRLARDGALSTTERDRALQRLTVDFQSFWVVETTREVVALARTALVRHSLRTGDALQLASCQYLRHALSENVPMVVFDDRLLRAARDAGVPIVP
ncbi:MAG TPA: type II toxin-antitoxin system VapC family toxin [Vicinamibacterales bacterium]|nr:type II toxin-antitoxin system VapC family toxin [Vicinamibacterales bacterium]